MLQNCHLGLKFMAEIEQTMAKLEEAIDADFRLWMTTEPHPKFPIGLLQMSIKITNEAPAGVRAGLKSSYAWLNQDMLDAVSHAAVEVDAVRALCFLLLVQERRKFGSARLQHPVRVQQSDLSACVMFMQNHLGDVDGGRKKRGCRLG